MRMLLLPLAFVSALTSISELLYLNYSDKPGTQSR